MTTYTMGDLVDPDHPAVVDALTRPCKLCGAPPTEPCRVSGPRVVHSMRCPE